MSSHSVHCVLSMPSRLMASISSNVSFVIFVLFVPYGLINFAYGLLTHKGICLMPWRERTVHRKAAEPYEPRVLWKIHFAEGRFYISSLASKGQREQIYRDYLLTLRVLTYPVMATKWKKEKVQRENGEWVDAQAPVIVSASRSTDIPKFYCDWFFRRLQIGYSAWTNPFNGVKSYVSYKDTRFIVFWSKDPKPLLNYLHILEEKHINCYIQYTLNDYVDEKLETGVPAVAQRIETFKRLVDRLGKGHVIWRFDPLVLTDKISMDDLLRKIEGIGDQLLGYTEKLVFSFADIASYRKVHNNLKANNINYIEWDTASMEIFAKKISELNKKWEYQLATCGEKIDISKYGIEKNHCVDDNLMIRIAHDDKELMDFLGVAIEYASFDVFGGSTIPEGAVMLSESTYAVKNKDNSDKGQREFCGCMMSKDIGEYNTCPHQCEYCYANTSKETAISNWKHHKLNPFAETITGL